MDKLTQELLNTFQRDFPITSRPFSEMGRILSLNSVVPFSEFEIIKTLKDIKTKGIVTRIGPVFDHKKAGASLLAAIKVPPEHLDVVAEQINQYAEVNHNYGRENDYNLWFVVTSPTKEHLEQVLTDMELTTGFPVLRLPMEKSYHIDLGFHLWSKGKFKSGVSCHADKAAPQKTIASSNHAPLNSNEQKQLRIMIQDGLPLTQKPFLDLAERLNLSEDRVISTFNYWLETGLIKRIGLVTNHHRLGFNSNAMIVWNIPDSQVDKIGEAFKESGLVSLCYRRSRQEPEWSYNLYCMIHSRDRASVAEHVETLVTLCGLEDIPKEVLFSNQQFKQKGGQYLMSTATPLQGFQGNASNQEFSGKNGFRSNPSCLRSSTKSFDTCKLKSSSAEQGIRAV